MGRLISVRGERPDLVAQDRWLAQDRRRAQPADRGGGMTTKKPARSGCILHARLDVQRRETGTAEDLPRSAEVGMYFRRTEIRRTEG